MEQRRLEILASSSLTPAQLEVFALFELLGIQIENKTFQALWKLVEMNVPTPVIMDILNDAKKQ